MPDSKKPSKPATDRVIGKIKDSGYRRFIEEVGKDDKHINNVHIAAFDHPKYGDCEAFVKLYHPKSKGLVNEITAYLCAHALEIHQPEYAFVANVPLKKLGRLTGWMAEAARQDETLVAFCTKRIDGKSAAIRLSRGHELDLVKKDVQEWADLPKTVALDENIAHTDRHLNNLIRVGRKNFAIIDGGMLANFEGSPDWTLQSLQPNMPYRNKLSEELWNNYPPKDMASHILHFAGRHPEAFGKIKDEVEYWWSLLLPKDEHNGFRDFFATRTQSIEGIIAGRYKLLT